LSAGTGTLVPYPGLDMLARRLRAAPAGMVQESGPHVCCPGACASASCSVRSVCVTNRYAYATCINICYACMRNVCVTSEYTVRIMCYRYSECVPYTHFLRISYASCYVSPTHAIRIILVSYASDTHPLAVRKRYAFPTHPIRICYALPTHPLRISLSSCSHFLRITYSSGSHFQRITYSSSSHFLRIRYASGMHFYSSRSHLVRIQSC
jgi:hypothetical protein